MGEHYMLLYPAEPDLPKPHWPRLRQQLIDRGFIADRHHERFDREGEEHFKPGPLFDRLSDAPRRDYDYTRICFEDYGDTASIIMDVENLLAPPSIPGTDRVFEEWLDFIQLWYDDNSQKWTDPETGKRYGLLDFDWEYTLGAGKCALAIRSPWYLNGDRTAAFLHELTGIPFRYCYYSL
jgi:hypothetical protein